MHGLGGGEKTTGRDGEREGESVVMKEGMAMLGERAGGGMRGGSGAPWTALGFALEVLHHVLESELCSAHGEAHQCASSKASSAAQKALLNRSRHCQGTGDRRLWSVEEQPSRAIRGFCGRCEAESKRSCWDRSSVCAANRLVSFFLNTAKPNC
mmetsp:Transcript_17470/g.41796  ORF Transcript_17470/g.41796 Transcript_17470/m.41796 type:complete len:154 (+) Transcript_17470:72-533(+)